MFDFISRLRTCTYVSPSFEVFELLTDTVERSGGKKGATQEILDSNESISQDQGNIATPFPMDFYFPGLNYDLAIDAFYKALEERYTLEVPGILGHPRWGDKNVFPFRWSQSEELVNGSHIGRLTVEFIEVFPRAFPDADDGDALSGLDELSAESSFFTDTAAALVNIAGKIQSAVGTVSSAIETITETVQAVEDAANAIQSGIDDLIDDVAGNLFLLTASVQRLIRTPGRIIDSTLSKINTYSDMVTDMCDSIKSDIESSPVNLKNNSILIQLFGGYAVAATAEAAVFTEFQDRSKAVEAIGILTDTLDSFNDIFEESRSLGTPGNVTQEFSGDHDFFSIVQDTITRVNQQILQQAFDLKGEKKIVLKSDSDVIYLCYKYYGDVEDDTIELFQNTNKIKNNEFYSIPAGREIVIYN